MKLPRAGDRVVLTDGQTARAIGSRSDGRVLVEIYTDAIQVLVNADEIDSWRPSGGMWP